MVKVSGFSNGINGFQATRIELLAESVDLSTSVPIGIRGTIENVDITGKTFTIGNLTVDYSMMNPVYGPNPFGFNTFSNLSTVNPIFVPHPLDNGVFVSVTGVTSDFTPGNAPSLALTAPQLIRPINQGIVAKEGDHVAVAGFVSDLSGTFFKMGGTPVDGSIFFLSGISNADFLEVEGTFKKGILVASKITLF
jgi:hypothetical protein